MVTIWSQCLGLGCFRCLLGVLHDGDLDDSEGWLDTRFEEFEKKFEAFKREVTFQSNRNGRGETVFPEVGATARG